MTEKHDSALAVNVDVMRATKEFRDGIRREFVRRMFACIVQGGHFEHYGRTLMADRAEKVMAAAGSTDA